MGFCFVIFMMVMSCSSLQAIFTFDRVQVIDNPDYLITNLSIDNSSRISVLNGNITLLRELNLKITLKIDIFQKNPSTNKKRLVFPVPKTNYCDAVKKLAMARGIDILIDQFEMSGIALARCPIKVGTYRFHNFTFDISCSPMLSMLRFNTSLSYQGVLLDENSRVPVVISKQIVFVTIAP